MYCIIDTTGALLREFKTWKEAETFRCVIGRHDVRIQRKNYSY